MAAAHDNADVTVLVEQVLDVARSTYERNVRVLGGDDPAQPEHPDVTVSRLIFESVAREQQCAAAFGELHRVVADWARDPSAAGVGVSALLAHAYEAAWSLNDLDARHQALAAANETSDPRITAQPEVRKLLQLTRLNQAHWAAMFLLALAWGYQSVARKDGFLLLQVDDVDVKIRSFVDCRHWLVVAVMSGIVCSAIGQLAQDLRSRKADPRTRPCVTFAKVLVAIAEACPEDPENSRRAVPLLSRAGAFASLGERLAELES